MAADLCPISWVEVRSSSAPPEAAGGPWPPVCPIEVLRLAPLVLLGAGDQGFAKGALYKVEASRPQGVPSAYLLARGFRGQTYLLV